MAGMTYTDLPEIKQRSGRNSYPLIADFDGFAQGLVGISDAGVLVKWGNVATTMFKGILLDYENSGTGVTDAADPDKPEGRVNENGDELINLPVAGLAAQTSLDALVYCATDNWRTDLTLTPTTSLAIGWVTRFRNAGYGDVRLFTPGEFLAKI